MGLNWPVFAGAGCRISLCYCREDLTRPTVSLVGTFGLLPWMMPANKIADKYEGAGITWIFQSSMDCFTARV